MAGERKALLVLASITPQAGDSVSVWLGGAYQQFSAVDGPATGPTDYQVFGYTNGSDGGRLTNALALREAIVARLQTLSLDASYDVPLIDMAGISGRYLITIQSTRYSHLDNFQPTISSNATGSAVNEETRLDAIEPIFVTATSSSCNCAGDATGRISLAVTGGTGTYSYLWADGATTADRQGLKAGTYSVLVTDISGASQLLAVVLAQNQALVVAVALSGGGISVGVTGGIAPYSYLWADGPTTADRTGLSEGDYAVTVRDSVGCFTTKSIHFETARFFFSRNPVVLDLEATDLATKPNLQFLCEVWVEESYLSGVFTNIAGVLTQPADAAGRTSFDLSSLLDSYVSPDFPAWGESGLVRADKAFRRFYFQHTESWDGAATATYVQRDTHYLVYGGLDFFEYAAGSYFRVYRPTQKPFLSWEPVQKEVQADQPEYLYYHHDSDTASSFSIRVIFTTSAGDKIRAIIGHADGVARFAVYRVGVGLPQLRAVLGLAVPAEIVAWEIAAVNADGLGITETRYFQLSDELATARRYFLYANSVGGVNTLATLGKSKSETDFSNVLVQRTLQPNYNANDGETFTTSVAGVPVLYVNTGYRTPAQMDAMQDFLLSEEIRYYDTDRYRPGSLQPQTAVPLADDDSGLLSLELAFVLPTLRRYTPTLPQRA